MGFLLSGYLITWLTVFDVAEKVGNTGLYGALGAAVCTVAMACRYRGQRSKKRGVPKGFPADRGAALDKYVRAYSELVTRCVSSSLPVPSEETPMSASDYALQYFAKSSIVVHNAPLAEPPKDEESKPQSG